MKKNAQRSQSDLEYRISIAHRAGALRHYTQERFNNYLLNIGLNVYTKQILPLETNEKTPQTETETDTETDTWTGYYHDIRREKNVLYPVWG